VKIRPINWSPEEAAERAGFRHIREKREQVRRKPRLKAGRACPDDKERKARMRRMLILAAVLAAAAASLSAQESALKVDEMVFCTGIEDRVPVGESTQFFESAARIYCYTRISGAADTLDVAHVWYFDGEEKARVDLAVRSASWRTWSSKKMLPGWSGLWRVDVLGPDGKVLLSREFVYKPMEEQEE